MTKTLSAFFLVTILAWSWGPTGHRAVGRIAENHLTAKAGHGVAAVIGPETLAQVSTWPDEIRSDPAWKHAAPWHFVNIDDGETYETTQKDPRGDVVTAMTRFEGVLRDLKAPHSEKVTALKFMVHLVGDIHQPLHAGRRTDQGGNKMSVSWMGQQTNLHAVWDSFIIDQEKLSFSELAQFIDHPTPQQIQQWQKAGYLDWVKESFDKRPDVYQIGDGKLGYAYSFQHLPYIKQRLVQAGVRLAGLLNSVYK